jgi:predicted ATPase/DNA-binding winged helix-turn-helix (wHTH) protein
MTAADPMALLAVDPRPQPYDLVARFNSFPVGPHATGALDAPDRALASITGSTERVISFGPFRLLTNQRLLMEADREVRVGSRALDILIALLEQPGELVTRSELMARVWPDTFVVEANLTVHVAALRRALGDGQGGNRYLVTIPGRGYRFVGLVTLSDLNAPGAQAATKPAHNLPGPLTRLIGRGDIVDNLIGELPQHGFITIAGPGGIGKTSVALMVGAGLMGHYEHGIWWVDLAPLGTPDLVPSAVAAVLAMDIRSEDAISGLIAELKDKHLLLVLDSCEHVIGVAATLATGLRKAAPGVQILATSREPLRAEGERVRRLSSLESPPISAILTAVEALEFPAVQLFVERAAATMDDFEFNDADAPIVTNICRKLDGIPLAIELAATRVDALGVRGLSARLDDQARLLTIGSRTGGLPRHHTMRATLDWSYELLTEPKRIVLRRLAIFAGGFSLEAAAAVVAEPNTDASEFVDRIANLVMKSLVAADIGGPTPLYRLLDTTRAYALEKLTESGEREEIACRHAEYFRDLFVVAKAEWDTLPTAEWFAAYGNQIDNVRAALDWAFSPDGDTAIGMTLTAASVPLWYQTLLMEEGRERVERALLSSEPGLGDASSSVRDGLSEEFGSLQTAKRLLERRTVGISAARAVGARCRAKSKRSALTVSNLDPDLWPHWPRARQGDGGCK